MGPKSVMPEVYAENMYRLTADEESDNDELKNIYFHNWWSFKCRK